jgi:hypothetical protein
MLAQFTWGEFLCCYGAVSLLWYLGLLFITYRKEALGMLGMGADAGHREGILKFKSQEEKPLGHRSGDADMEGEVEDFEAGVRPPANRLKHNSGAVPEKDQDNGLMGKVMPQQGLDRIETGCPSFVQTEKESEGETVAGTGEVLGGGLYNDLVTGIREIYSILAANDGNKQDFFGMVSQLKAEMGPVGSSPCIPKVNAFVRDSAPFAISKQELESLWD